MPCCCVNGCFNRYSPSSTIKFYRIPSGRRQFQILRRRLWVEAIQTANGEVLPGGANLRICGAHFVSGEASTDPDRPNFVPTLFRSTKSDQSPSTQTIWTSVHQNTCLQKEYVETGTTARGQDAETEKSTTLREEGATEKSTTIREEGATEKSTSIREEVTTEKSTTIREEGATEKSTTLKEEGVTEKSTTIREEGATEKSTTQREEGATEKSTTLSEEATTKSTTVSEDAETNTSPTQPASESPSDHESSALMETEEEPLPERQTSLCSSVSKEEAAEDKKINDKDQGVTKSETEDEKDNPENKSSLNVPPSPRKPLGGTLKVDKINPVVLLKPLIVPPGAYHVKLSSLTHTAASHKEQPEETDSSETGFAESCSVTRDQPVFPCNLCDRTFTTSHYLKRHKLLHVRDVRKCLRCGVLFCRRHNHVLFQTRAEPLPESEEESSGSEEELPDNRVNAEKEKTSEVTEIDGGALRTRTETPPACPAVTDVPLLKTAPLIDIRKPLMASVKPPTVPSPPPPILRLPNNQEALFQIKPLVSSPTLTKANLPQPPQLPSSLKIFSAHHLTSALLDVQRNYEYILSKPKNKAVKFKEEPDEQVNICQVQPPVKRVKLEKIAYDLEVVI
ncbi:uncharacterized protein LOC110369339 isoform X1 [Fundulus heteroclitus]|uniref:uncharacterized protein LOC110369339 isoform X1 n=1 Tax=Fundulus heteroclitus TaxID=8078 RepID=UPI00165BC320|nr:uncharacterized protein LOC110369339 isoform X1 [Fundulus heteroclitus]